jgi:hypothetical protein
MKTKHHALSNDTIGHTAVLIGFAARSFLPMASAPRSARCV